MIQKEIIIEKGRYAALFTIPLRTLSQLVTVLSSTILIRILSKNDYGIYNLLYSSIAMITMITSFGLGNVLQRYLPEYFAKGDYTCARKLFYTTLIIRFLSSAVILIAIITLWEKLAPYLQIAQYRSYFILFCFIIILHQQWGLINICLGSAYLHKYQQTFVVLFITVKLTGYAVSYYFSVSLHRIIMIDLCAYLLLIACLMAVYYKYYPKGVTRSDFNKYELKRIVRYAVLYSLNDVGVKILGVDIDNFFIAYFLDPLSVGIYAFCTRVSSMVIRMLPIAYFQDVLRPLFFGLGYDAAPEKTRTGFSLLLKCQYMLAIPIFFLTWAAASEFISLFFGSKYTPYIDIFIVVFAFKVLGSFTIPVGFIAQLKERAGIVLISKIFLIYNIASAYVLIPKFGIIGAAIATGTANLFKDLFIWWFVKDSAEFMKLIKFLIKTCVFWSLAALVVFQLKQLIPTTVGDLLLFGASFLIFFSVYLKLTLFDSAEFIIIRKALHPYRHKRFINWIAYQRFI